MGQRMSFEGWRPLAQRHARGAYCRMLPSKAQRMGHQNTAQRRNGPSEITVNERTVFILLPVCKWSADCDDVSMSRK
jgi:hypothetical protein